LKINYTLPGYRPETDVARDLVESLDSPFKNRMQAFEQRPPVSWKELLGLNLMPPDPSQVAHPQSSYSRVVDAAALRQQWRDLLTRHGGAEELQDSSEPVRRMLELLQTYQKESDALFSCGVSEAER
jgi:hypothetical protein